MPKHIIFAIASSLALATGCAELDEPQSEAEVESELDLVALRVLVDNFDPPGSLPPSHGYVLVSPINEQCSDGFPAAPPDGDCTFYVPDGLLVTLTIQNECSRFIRWAGACSGSNISCTIPMLGATTVKAIFATSPCQ